MFGTALFCEVVDYVLCLDFGLIWMFGFMVVAVICFYVGSGDCENCWWCMFFVMSVGCCLLVVVASWLWVLVLLWWVRKLGYVVCFWLFIVADVRLWWRIEKLAFVFVCLLLQVPVWFEIGSCNLFAGLLCFVMCYPLQRLPSSTTPSAPLPMPFENKEEFQKQLTELKLERDTWKRICLEAELKNETLSGKIEELQHQLLIQNRRLIEKDVLLQWKDDLLRHDATRKRKYIDLFSGTHSDSDDSDWC